MCVIFIGGSFLALEVLNRLCRFARRRRKDNRSSFAAVKRERDRGSRTLDVWRVCESAKRAATAKSIEILLAYRAFAAMHSAF